MQKIYSYITYLIKTLVNGDNVILDNSVEYELLFDLAKKHGIENMVYAALCQASDLPDIIRNKYEYIGQTAIMVEAVQSIALDQIIDEFENNHIEYIVMKGSEIKYLYPMPDYRQSSDIDILVHKKDLATINEIMLKNDYCEDKMDEFELHRGYRKKPYILIEIHDKLVETQNRCYNCLNKVWDNCTNTTGYNYRKSMNKEFEYVFYMAHFCKHVKNGGAGIKFLVDLWILRRKYCDVYNKKLLSKLLDDANITDFSNLTEKLISVWFEEDYSEDENVKTFEKFILQGGLYGTIEQRNDLINNKIYKNGIEKWRFIIRYVIHSIFPSQETLRQEYPFILKTKFLVPAAVILRLVKRVSVDRKQSHKKILAITQSDDNKSKSLNYLLKIVS